MDRSKDNMDVTWQIEETSPSFKCNGTKDQKDGTIEVNLEPYEGMIEGSPHENIVSGDGQMEGAKSLNGQMEGTKPLDGHMAGTKSMGGQMEGTNSLDRQIEEKQGYNSTKISQDIGNGEKLSFNKSFDRQNSTTPSSPRNHGQELEDKLIGLYISDTLNYIVATETENLDATAGTADRQPVVLRREYPTYTPPPQVTVGTLKKILTRLELKKKPRRRLQKCDISWPLPGSLVIRGPDGALEDGLISLFVDDLLDYIGKTEDKIVAGAERPNPAHLSASANIPTVHKDTVKQTKSDTEAKSRAVSLPSKSAKSKSFFSRLFGDRRRYWA